MKIKPGDLLELQHDSDFAIGTVFGRSPVETIKKKTILLYLEATESLLEELCCYWFLLPNGKKCYYVAPPNKNLGFRFRKVKP